MSAYDAYVAKCRCMIGRLLTDEDYAHLAACRSVKRAAALLNTLPAYADFITDVDGVMNRSLLEFELEQARFETYARLYRFSGGVLREFIRDMMREFEVYHLLSAIRSVKSGDTATQRYLPTFLAEHSTLDFGRLFSAASMEELLSALGTHPFAPIFADSLRGGHCDLARLETALYNDHYVSLWEKTAARFDRANADALRRFIGVRADLINISRLLRLRNLARLQSGSPPDMQALLPVLVPLRGRLREDDLRTMLSMPRTEDIHAYCARIYGSDAAIFADASAGGDSFAHLISAYSHRQISAPDAPISVSLGYFTLHKIEIDNVIYIIEGIRYEMPAETIEKRLIR